MRCNNLTDIYLPEALTDFSSLSFTQTGTFSENDHVITLHVKEGSYADTAFDTYADSYMEKEYY